MNHLSFIRQLLFAALLLLPFSAQAHKISIFAWPEGSEIHGEVKFNGGRKAKNVQIAVQNTADSAVLAETVCDENGEFRVALPEQALKTHPDLLLVANGGEGHRGEWRLEATEYASAASAATSPAAAASSAAPAVPTATPTPAAQTYAVSATTVVGEQLLRRVVSEELSKGLSPVRKALAERHDQEPTLRDIVGGMGWIIGLAGMAAWAQSRRQCR
jgi:nickel transport protein